MIRCRSCQSDSVKVFLDLGAQPLPNQFLPWEAEQAVQRFPLRVMYCPDCHLVQLADHLDPGEVFDDTFKYFSSYSESLLAHSEAYAKMAAERYALDRESRIVEIGSNDGYLLQYFKKMGCENILGVEPTASTAAEAIKKGVPTHQAFFSLTTAQQVASSGLADLIVANNVIAHVPGLNDFFSGIKALMSPNGAATVEFQSLDFLIENAAFDLIYHEHYSYLSLTALMAILERNGLSAVDVEGLETQGKSLRVTIRHQEQGINPKPSVGLQLEREADMGLDDYRTFDCFAAEVERKKQACADLFTRLATENVKIAGYGAPAKGSVLLNVLGLDNRTIPYTVDRNVHKQNQVMAGCSVPVSPVERLYRDKPDYVVILPWNIKEEIVAQNVGVYEWGGRFITLIPEIEIIEEEEHVRVD